MQLVTTVSRESLKYVQDFSQWLPSYLCISFFAIFLSFYDVDLPNNPYFKSLEKIDREREASKIGYGCKKSSFLLFS